MNKIFKTEGRTTKELDTLTLYVVLGTVIGARLGHCLFYGPWFDVVDPAGNVIEEGYISHPLNMLKIWEGGLASHGGAIGIMIALWLYVRKTKENLWWIFDRIVIAVAFSGMCIRLGNLMNSEIVGKKTDLLWAFRFIQHDIEESYHSMSNFLSIPGEKQMNFIEGIQARHPSQLYEALFFFVTLIAFYFLWRNKKYSWPAGFMFGLFLTLVFTFRFCVEFTKELQAEFEEGLPIDMGQVLSIPFVLAGIFIMYWSKTKNQPHKLRANA
jgi:phosphatidylglycerol---prolipoprotein diacylglyceryl transferase